MITILGEGVMPMGISPLKRSRLFIAIYAAVAAAIVSSAPLGVGSAPAAESPLVLAMSTHCPERGLYSGCLILAIDRGDFDLSLQDHSASTLSIRGRLNRGPERTYVLRVELADDGWKIRVAYLGRSNQNNPIFLTRGGGFEVTESGFDLQFSSPDIILIDEQRREVVAQYYSDGRLQLKHGRPELWDSQGVICVSAIQNIPGLLRADRDSCKAHPDYEKPTDLTLERLVAMAPLLQAYDLHALKADKDALVFGGGGCYLDVSRLRGSHYLIAAFLCEHEE